MTARIAASVLGLSASVCLASAAAAAPPLSSAARALAASATAHSNKVCLAARPFYWEIGDAHSSLASGSEGASAPSAGTPMPISTASEWIYAAYVAQVRDGKLTSTDIAALTMRSGYSNLQPDRCVHATGYPHPQTVSECFGAAHLVGGANNNYRSTQVDRFDFNGGHFQQLAATDAALKDLNATTLTGVIGTRLGTTGTFNYESPLLDAGVRTTPAAYASFLRNILGSKLRIRELLGQHAVCTNPGRCQQAVSTPLPQTESSHYSLGHWVEDDPRIGDGAFSDPGLFGFYPWIDQSATYYGVLARVSHAPGAHVGSMQCGRLIRKAWESGKVQ